MPALLAMLIASLASWLIDGLIRPVAGAGTATVVSLLVGSVSFYVAKRFVSALRSES